MAARTTTRLLAAAVVIGAGVYFAPKLVDMAGSVIVDVTGASDAVIVGEGDNAIMVAADARSKVAPCVTHEIIRTRQCDGLRILLVDAAKMPFIARNTKLAWESGRPAVLTMNRPKERANRRIACPPSFPRPYGGQCDEYPMARTEQGGNGARAEEVPDRENQCQGGSYGAQYPNDGEQFLVVITHPGLTAPGPFTGTDVAKEQGQC